MDLSGGLNGRYGDAYVVEGGPISESGEILARVMVGRARRLVRLVEATGCAAGCLRVSELTLSANNPRRCNSGSLRAQVTLKVTDEAGRALRGVQVSGRFLDNYWLDGVWQGTTDRKGKVRFSHNGPPCVGAISFLVTDAAAAGEEDPGAGATRVTVRPWTARYSSGGNRRAAGRPARSRARGDLRRRGASQQTHTSREIPR